MGPQDRSGRRKISPHRDSIPESSSSYSVSIQTELPGQVYIYKISITISERLQDMLKVDRRRTNFIFPQDDSYRNHALPVLLSALREQDVKFSSLKYI